jgi:hypothetical protein
MDLNATLLQVATVTESSPSPANPFAFIHYWTCTYWRENGDPRLNEYLFMRSFLPAAACLTLYVVFVAWAGPWWMERRARPYRLRRIIILYNTAMSYFNAAIFTGILIQFPVFLRIMSDTAYPADFSRTSEFEAHIIFFNYLYMLSKFVDLLDTVFFVLRKKVTPPPLIPY